MAVVMIDRQIDGPTAWTRATLAPGDGWSRLSEACVAELLAVAAELRANPLPVLALAPADFDLAHCRRAAARIRALLDDGPGFAIVDRLPLDRLRREEARRGVLAPVLAHRPAGGAEVGRHHGL